MTRVHDSRTSRCARGVSTTLAFAVLAAGSLAGCAARRTRAPHVLDAPAATSVAVGLLRSKGVTGVVVCRTTSVQAPVGAFVVDATGELAREGRGYSLFRIGVRDGSDGPQFPAGGELVFIAKGLDSAGQTVWIPPPGPDAVSAESGFVEAYEFLYDRAEFEQVPRRCAH